jgi:putative inorganic carbon (hco3(-)) transporter
MNSADAGGARELPSDWLLLALIVALPLMKPAVSGEVITADLLFVALALVLAVETLAGRRRLPSLRGYAPLLAYVASLAPSLLASREIGASLFKFATEFYLIGLAAVPAWLIDSEAKFRRAVLAWLAVTALVCLVGILGLLAFATGRATALLDYSSYGFGSLPPGDYPRLALTFFNANMACNYLTVSLALTLLARRLRYIGQASSGLLLAGIAVASLSTISPGLGGIALMAGLWLWLTRRDPHPLLTAAGLTLGCIVAALCVAAQAFTPVAHSTAPFRIQLAGGLILYPAPRFLTWSAALETFVHHPLIGIGIGIDPVHVGFANPSGFEVLTDAHNVFLSIAAQCGVAGLVGMAAIIGFVIARTPWSAAAHETQLRVFLLGAAFLNVFAYQGLGGAFEDTRHIWLLLGLFIAATRLPLTRADGSNRRAGEPSPG